MSKDKKAPSSSVSEQQVRRRKLVAKLEQNPEEMAVVAARGRRAQIDSDLASTAES